MALAHWKKTGGTWNGMEWKVCMFIHGFRYFDRFHSVSVNISSKFHLRCAPSEANFPDLAATFNLMVAQCSTVCN